MTKRVQMGTIRVRGLRALLACVVALSLCGFAVAAAARPPSMLDYSPVLDQGLLGEGRQAYRERADHDRARDAYEAFSLYYRENPDDPVAGWHLAMSCYYMGKRVARSKEERKRLYAEGRDRAEHALEQDAECAPCHLLAGINHALWGREVGIFRTLVGLPSVKAHLKRAAELDAAFAGAAAHRVQASIAQALPVMFGGGKKRARRWIEKAIEVSPEEPLNYELLAYLLLEKFDEKERALEVARRGLRVPDPGPHYVESRDALEELQKLVERYGAPEEASSTRRADEPERAHEKTPVARVDGPQRPDPATLPVPAKTSSASGGHTVNASR